MRACGCVEKTFEKCFLRKKEHDVCAHACSLCMFARKAEAQLFLTVDFVWFGYMQGSGGGPTEGNCSGYLLRSTSKKWVKNSILAVDAGTHLSGIVKILENHASTRKNSEDSPFAGAPLPAGSPKVNAAFITRELVSTYLLTHSHLDHLSGFVINTASFSNMAQPKRVAALPHVINALKTHIFNDVIWPNLSDEDAGVGLLTYQRMQVAHPYIPVSEGLSAQVWAVSHGHCMKSHTHWGRKSSAGIPCDGAHSGHDHQARWCVLDSAVFFVRDDASGQEVMMWGDVEPGPFRPPCPVYAHRY